MPDETQDVKMLWEEPK